MPNLTIFTLIFLFLLFDMVSKGLRPIVNITGCDFISQQNISDIVIFNWHTH